MENEIQPVKKHSFFQSMPPKMAFIFGMVTATAVLLIAALIILIPISLRDKSGDVAGAETTNTAQAGTNTAVAVDISKVNIEGHPFFGNANTPATMAYWTDYQCPFCQRFDKETLPSIIKQYVDTGKLKIVMKDFAFLGPDSDAAALAARAVWEVAPKKFLAWHEAIYSKQDGENTGWGKKEDIIALTKTVSGIDANKVSKLMDQKKVEYQKSIDADKAEGDSMGVNGTPGFIVGKQLISGAQPLKAFTAAIDAALAGN